MAVRAVLTTITLTAILLNTGVLRAGNKVYVTLLVDEEEPAVERLWKERLNQRLERASKIIHKFADIRFIVGGHKTWHSDNRINNFKKSLREFERKAKTRPGEVAVGFTSQYRFTPGRHHMGGTRGPLNPHVLIRENNPQLVEIERLEILVHELCHFLGAAHSDRKTSVMRAILGDGQARSRRFEISLDPQNARIVQLVAREVSHLDVRFFADLTRQTKIEIGEQYAELISKLPRDPIAARLLKLVE